MLSVEFASGGQTLGPPVCVCGGALPPALCLSSKALLFRHVRLWLLYIFSEGPVKGCHFLDRAEVQVALKTALFASRKLSNSCTNADWRTVLCRGETGSESFLVPQDCVYNSYRGTLFPYYTDIRHRITILWNYVLHKYYHSYKPKGLSVIIQMNIYWYTLIQIYKYKCLINIFIWNISVQFSPWYWFQ